MYLSKYYMFHTYPDGSVVLLNTLSGSITPLKEGVRMPEEGCFEAEKLGGEEIGLLKEAGLLFRDQAEEEERIRYFMDRRKEEWKKEPIAHVIYLSYHCNLKCTYCCYSGLRERKKVMEYEDVDKIIALIERIQGESGRDSRICLFGGEPLLKGSYRLVEYALKNIRLLADREKEKGRRCRVMIFTNGVEIPYFKELLENYKEYIEHVLVTLIGEKAVHDKLRVFRDGTGSYDRVTEGIGQLLTTGIPTWIVTNIDRSNLNELKDNVKLIRERGWDNYENFMGYYFGRIKYYDSAHPDAVTESELLKEAIECLKDDEEAQRWYNFGDMRLLKAVKSFCHYASGESDRLYHTLYGCGSGSLAQYSYDADGTLYTCSGAMGIKGYEIGDYGREEAIEPCKAEWWRGREVLKIEKCRNCKLAFLCGGGCAYAAKEINGSEYLPCCGDSEKLMHSYLDGMWQGIHIGYKDLLRD